MNYKDKFGNVAVIGAAGKMGSGIVLLMAIEQTIRNKTDNKNNFLYAVDISESSLKNLLKFIKVQSVKYAEKNIVFLRKLYNDNRELIENSQIIEAFSDEVLSTIIISKNVSALYNSDLIFEAVKESVELKVQLFSEIEKNAKRVPWYFTNTSSIPISELDTKADLKGRIIGFHFYNPPAVQKLVELIPAENTNNEIIDFSYALAKRINKLIIPANDKAGFIGNGHFMRDIIVAFKMVNDLKNQFSEAEAIYIINKITEEFLIRPMGIFQLIDYVGVDICISIMQVMKVHFNDINESGLIEFMEAGILGGQNSDGTQKNGILKYEKHRPAAVYNRELNDYHDFDDFNNKLESFIGNIPELNYKWKTLVRSSNRIEKVSKYFDELRSMDTKGAELALEYSIMSKSSALKLIDKKVALSVDDVNMVMEKGFYHAYGPIQGFIG